MYILDGMTFVQMTKSGGAATFGELAAKYYSIFSSPLSTIKCDCVHVVFADQYFEMWKFTFMDLRYQYPSNGPST